METEIDRVVDADEDMAQIDAYISKTMPNASERERNYARSVIILSRSKKKSAPEPECEPFTKRQLKVIEEMIDKRIREVNLNVDVGRGDPYGWHDIKIEVSLRFDYDDTITSANDGFSFPNTNREW